MKKVLALITALLPMLVACTNGSMERKLTSQDSTSVAVEEVNAQRSLIITKVCDSIFALHPGNINNKIIQEDIAADLTKYVLSYKGKHMPMLEEITFKMKGIAQEGNHYVAVLMYKSEADKKDLGQEVQVCVKATREEAATFYEGRDYKVKGLVNGFPFQSAMPYAIEIYSSDRPTLSFGAIELSDAEVILA